MLEKLSVSKQEKPFGVANGQIQRGNYTQALSAAVHAVAVHLEPDLKSNLLASIKGDC